MKCSLYESERLIKERQARTMLDTVHRLNRNLGYKTPPHRILTTHQCLQRLDLWEILTPCWDHCSGLLWSFQCCVVSTEFLCFGSSAGGEIGTFSCAGCFHFTPPANLVWHHLNTHQGHCCRPSQYVHLYSVKYQA